ncbi:MAG TPA: thiamine pyrophosphate-binding protein [Solirubrobacteraceae bacterium]|jgi:benzoylformate decarboxylase|nr:thiamine pyrophosphate-binding protein [Solirubrobacteraceae bacterium]
MIDEAQRTAAPATDDPREPRSGVRTVRDAVFDVLRRCGMTTIFGNPGSTEIPFLAGLPSDIHFVLGLHEGAVVGIATGYAVARGEPALVNLHTAPGLGNAINAIANARDMRVPLVVLVGQQDRRQLAYEPFLTGRALERLAGEYPVWSSLPVRPQDVPGAIARAYNEAITGRGPALVVVPMGDWLEPADEFAAGWPERTVRTATVAPSEVSELAEMIDRARSPALVVGRDGGEEGWESVIGLAERLRCPVWQESFARAAGFPQDHPQFAGHLPWRRRLMRDTLAPHDLVVAVGTSAFRLYLYDDPGPMVAEGTRVAVLTDDSAEAYRSPCSLAVVAPVAAACSALAEQVAERDGDLPAPLRRPAAPPPPGADEPLAPGHVYAALAQRLPRNAVIVEETPSSQPELYQRVPISAPGGFVACGNGGLGFGVAGSVGLRMGNPERPVIGVVGDGSSMYAIQALWSAAHYEVGVLLLVMANGRYAVMDGLARQAGAAAAWPAFGSIDIAGIARCLGCPAVNVATHEQLIETFDEVLPHLAGRREPLLVEVALG